MFPFLLALVLTHASAKSPASKPACTARELRGKDCRLVIGNYQIRLLSDTIARDDGTWHTVDSMPLKGDGVTWEKMTFSTQLGLPLLQMWIWDSGTGEAQVQALHWIIGDAREGSLKILSDGVVRRRRLKPVEEIAPEPNAKPLPKPKPAFLYDGYESHSLKAAKGGKLEYQLGAKKKILDPDAPVEKPPESEKGH